MGGCGLWGPKIIRIPRGHWRRSPPGCSPLKLFPSPKFETVFPPGKPGALFSWCCGVWGPPPKQTVLLNTVWSDISVFLEVSFWFPKGKNVLKFKPTPYLYWERGPLFGGGPKGNIGPLPERGGKTGFFPFREGPRVFPQNLIFWNFPGKLKIDTFFQKKMQPNSQRKSFEEICLFKVLIGARKSCLFFKLQKKPPWPKNFWF